MVVGVAVGVGIGVAVEAGMVVAAVGVRMGVAVGVGCEQPIATGRTKAMAIPTTRDALARISDADLASAIPHLVCTRG